MTEGVFDNGTTINLRRSSVWNETLDFSSSQIAPNAGENPIITIQSYGPSNEPLPVIDGSKIIDGVWTASEEYGVVNDGKTKIWQTTVTNFRGADLFSNLFAPGKNYSQARYPDTGSIPIAVAGLRT
jgi:hypothetical protein